MKKGFTLIELLAVIVILAIIALIATPIVLNIIDESKENANLRSAEMYLDAVEMSIATSTLNNKKIKNGTYNVLEGGNICLEYTDNKCTDELKVEVDGEVPNSGSTVTIKNGKITDISFILNNKTIAKNEKGELVYKTKPCEYTKDDDGYEMVTCGTESFYIMEKTENTITMLSMYNLYVGNITTWHDDYSYFFTNPLKNPTNKQSELAKGYFSGDSTYYGTVAFSSIPYWSSTVRNYPAWVYNQDSNLYTYVSEYERILKNELKVSSASATLISYEQVKDLIENKDNPSWLYNTTYYTGSASDTPTMWCVSSSGNFCSIGFDSRDYGVRPVVTISTSEVQ